MVDPSGNSRNSVDIMHESVMFFYGNCLNEHKQVAGRGGLVVGLRKSNGDLCDILGNPSYISIVLLESSDELLYIG